MFGHTGLLVGAFVFLACSLPSLLRSILRSIFLFFIFLYVHPFNRSSIGWFGQGGILLAVALRAVLKAGNTRDKIYVEDSSSYMEEQKPLAPTVHNQNQ